MFAVAGPDEASVATASWPLATPDAAFCDANAKAGCARPCCLSAGMRVLGFDAGTLLAGGLAGWRAAEGCSRGFASGRTEGCRRSLAGDLARDAAGTLAAAVATGLEALEDATTDGLVVAVARGSANAAAGGFAAAIAGGLADAAARSWADPALRDFAAAPTGGCAGATAQCLVCAATGGFTGAAAQGLAGAITAGFAVGIAGATAEGLAIFAAWGFVCATAEALAGCCKSAAECFAIVDAGDCGQVLTAGVFMGDSAAAAGGRGCVAADRLGQACGLITSVQGCMLGSAVEEAEMTMACD